MQILASSLVNKVTDEHVGPITGTHIGPVTGNMLPRSLVNILAKSPGFPTGVANMALQNLMRGGLSQNIRGAWGELKMLLKNTCEGSHLIVKLPAISLQASKFTKNELLQTYFSRILARFKLLFVLFLGIISWKGVSCFNGESCFSKKIVRWGGNPHAPPPHYGKPESPAEHLGWVTSEHFDRGTREHLGKVTGENVAQVTGRNTDQVNGECVGQVTGEHVG